MNGIYELGSNLKSKITLSSSNTSSKVGKQDKNARSARRKPVTYYTDPLNPPPSSTAETSKSSSNSKNDNLNGIIPNKISIKAARRFDELDRENYSDVRVELPKSITGLIVLRRTNPNAAVKRALVSRKTWSNYLDEVKTIRGLQNKPLVIPVDKLVMAKLCTICGSVSFSICTKCSERVCGVKCMDIHHQTRCTQF
ncbi:hypothetical protein DAMA08_002730 [Martiniozyma asiatica (nom. inval.)]|nr:hypothetical protein DAMA08_002730 [Martiniozyma asiatica]